jgi:hypothetical protein
VQLDGDTENVLRPAQKKEFASLIAWFEEQNIPAQAASFNPKEVPVLMIYPKDAELLRDSHVALETDDLPASMTPLVQAFVDERLAEGAGWEGTLFLNASCSLIRELARKPDSPSRAATLRLLYHLSRLFCGRLLRPSEAAGAFQELTQALREIGA